MTLNYSIPTNVGGGAYATTINGALAALDLPTAVVRAPAFGAVGNGVADDTSAIQDAIDVVAAAGGGFVFLPVGIYRVTAMLIVPSNVWLRGAGASSIIRLGANGLYGVVSLDNATSRNGILDLAIDGQNGAHTGTGFGVVVGADDAVLERVHVYDTINNGVEVGGADRVKVIDCDFEGSESNAIRFANSSHDGLVRGCRVRDCVNGVFGYGGSDGSTSCDRLTIIDNVVSDITNTSHALAQDGGIAVSGCEEPVIRGNRVKDSVGRGIHVFGYCPGADVSHNRVRDCGLTSGTAGIDLGDVGDYDFTVKGNRSYHNGGSGIVTAPLRHSILEGNICAQNGQAGLYPDTAQQGITLIGVVSPEIIQTCLTVIGNICYDDQAVKTQTYGIIEINSDSSSNDDYHTNGIFIGNQLKGNQVAGLALLDTTAVNEHNQV